jgi:hypothetical protein
MSKLKSGEVHCQKERQLPEELQAGKRNDSPKLKHATILKKILS